MLPSYEEITTSKRKYAESFQKQYLNTDHYNAKILVEPYQGWYVVQNNRIDHLPKENSIELMVMITIVIISKLSTRSSY